MNAFHSFFPDAVAATYGVNVALHGLTLSLFGWAMLSIMRAATRRAFVAALWLALASLGPWFTAASLPHAEEMISPRSPAVVVPSHRPNLVWTIRTGEAATTKPQLEVGPRQSVIEWPSLLSAAMILWGIGAALFLLRQGWLTARILRWRRRLRPLAHDERARIESFSGTPLPPRCALFEGTGSPCVVGWWRPVLAVPVCALTEWTPSQWRWVLSHEGRHLSGHDTLLSGLLTLLRCVWWWNPFAHLLLERWEAAREEVCDMASIREPAEASAYAKFLLQLAQTSPALHPAMVSMAKARPAAKLHRRLTAVLHGKGSPIRMTWRYVMGNMAWAGAVAMGLSCAGIKAESQGGGEGKVATKQDAPPSGKGARVYIKTDCYETDTAGVQSLKDEGILSYAEFNRLIRDISQRKLTSMETLRATSWTGQSASMEDTRLEPSITDGKSPVLAPPDFIGVRAEISVGLSGDQLQVHFTTDVSDHIDPIVDGDTIRQNPIVAHLRRTGAVVLGNEERLCLRMGEIQTGRTFLILITVNAIDPSTGEMIGVKEAIQRAEAFKSRPTPNIAAKSVKLSIQIMDAVEKESEYRAHLRWLLDAILPNAAHERTGSRVPKGKIVGDFKFIPPSTPASVNYTSVLSPAQLAALQGKIKERKDATFSFLPKVITKSDQRVEYKADPSQEKFSLSVDPVIETDGETIDLRASLPGQDQGDPYSTEVSLFDGQSMVVSGFAKRDVTHAVHDEDKENLHRLFIITAKIVE